MKHANISLIHARVELTRFVRKYNQRVGGPLSLHSKTSLKKKKKVIYHDCMNKKKKILSLFG